MSESNESIVNNPAAPADYLELTIAEPALSLLRELVPLVEGATDEKTVLLRAIGILSTANGREIFIEGKHGKLFQVAELWRRS